MRCYLYLSLFLPFCLSCIVGTTWDKDFRICLVLSSLKVDDNNFDKNSEFYVPEDKVSGGSGEVG